jgi:hypothetical protein
MVGPNNMKKCNMCGGEKPLSEFSMRTKSTLISLRGNCRPCRAIEMRNYRKLGTTKKNIFEGKSLAHLDRTLLALNLAYKKHGTSIIKNSITKDSV